MSKEVIEQIEFAFQNGEVNFRACAILEPRAAEQGMCMVLGQIVLLSTQLDDDIALLTVSQYEERIEELLQEYGMELLVSGLVDSSEDELPDIAEVEFNG